MWKVEEEENPQENSTRYSSLAPSTTSFDSCRSDEPLIHTKDDHPPLYQGIKAAHTQIKKLLASLSQGDRRRALDDFSDEEDF